MTRILLGQLGSNGDCLYATTIARQIKHDFPGCHLTWAISPLCRPVIENNPDVDDVWEIGLHEWGDIFGAGWHAFEKEAWNRVARGEFDHAFMTQIAPVNFGKYDGTVRPSIFRNYPGPITVPIETVIRLTDAERQRVHDWVHASGIGSYGNVVIFECASKSGQSFVKPEHAVQIAKQVISAKPDTCFVLSTHLPIELDDPRVVHGGALGLRETAELTHHADLFVGCGSGVTVAATSAAAKTLPNIQILAGWTGVYASFRHDFEYFSKRSDHFLETTTESPEAIAEMILSALNEGFATAKDRFDERIAPQFEWYFGQIRWALLNSRQYLDAARSLMTIMKRYGEQPALLDFGGREILPGLSEVMAYIKDADPEAFSNVSKELERFI